MISFKNKIKGVFLCFIIALFSLWVVSCFDFFEIIGAPVIAIITGMIISLIIKNKSSLASGITFTSKKILQYAIIFLGFGLNLSTVGEVGLKSLPIIVSTISVSLFVAYAFYKLLKIPAKTSTLIGVGSAICGGSAIAATAPVINADEEEVAQAISVIFFFNIIAAVIFPGLGSFLGLSDPGFAMFAGTAINDTSSVTAAASTWDTIHKTNGSVLAYATIVKLVRTLAIIPITFFLSIHTINTKKKKDPSAEKSFSAKKIFPVFIIFFLIASFFTTVTTSFVSGTSLIFIENIFEQLKLLSKFLIVMAMGAIGFNTNIIKLLKKGPKPLFLGFCCWFAITIVSLVLQKIFNLF